VKETVRSGRIEWPVFVIDGKKRLRFEKISREG